MSQTPTRRIIRLPEVRARVGNVNPSTIWRWERSDDAKVRFPARVKIGPNATGWYEDEVNTWIEQRRSAL